MRLLLLAALLAAMPAMASPALDPTWQRLLRVGENISAGPGFYLSGRAHAEAELTAFLAAAASADRSQPDQHPRCRFPARAAWLQANHPALTQDWPEQPCPALQEWLDNLDVGQITLVFASDYLNNPSSMFGHTLLRLDARQHGDDVRLLSYAINYSAQTNTSNGLEFAWKGLTGGYPGAFSLLPYYEKVKEYNDWESRDLWEYELTLDDDEIRRLLLTLWDWRGVTAPYYFFTRNCSYELLGLIDMARPGLDLQARFRWHAMPTDTLRAVLDQPGLLKRVTWRAASGTLLDTATRRNTAQVNRTALALSERGQATSLAPLPTEQQAQALEAAYDHLYLQHVNHRGGQDAPERLRQLLVQRSQLDVPDQRLNPPRPDVDPASGHGTGRWSLGVGVDEQPFALLRYRPAYHDWLDPSGGYRTGARIDFLDLALRLDRDGPGIEEATVVGIDSLAPVSGLQVPTSWSVRLGVDRGLSDRDDDRRHAQTVFEGGAGLAGWLRPGLLCYGQSQGDLRTARSYAKGWEAGFGARLGCLGQVGDGHPETLRWLLELRPMFAHPVNDWRYELRAGTQFNLDRTQALRLDIRQQWREQQASVISLSWLHYF